MNALLLNKNYENYIYNYSSKFINPLITYFNITKFGPGYPNFNNNFDLKDIENFYKKKFDFIIIGHHFLSEKLNGAIFDFKTSLNLNKIKIPIFFFLNKEYKNLKRNLEFIKKINTKAIFSHHHISKFLGKDFYFIPFGFDDNLINTSIEKNVDIFFSGILKNNHAKFTNSNRLKIREEIFYHFLNFNLKKKNIYNNYKIYWNNFNYLSPYKKILGFFFKELFQLSEKNYYRMLGLSKISFCTLSAYNQVGPRFFESLGSGCLVFCPKTNIYKKYSLDLTKNIIQFESEKDFTVKVKKYLDNYKNFENEIRTNQKSFVELYSYDSRSKDIFNIIKKKL